MLQSQPDKTPVNKPVTPPVNDQSKLVLSANIADPDDFYDELLHAHDDLSKQQSDDFNARLILVLCNHIGDRQIIRDALQSARQSTVNDDEGAPGEQMRSDPG